MALVSTVSVRFLKLARSSHGERLTGSPKCVAGLVTFFLLSRTVDA